MEEMGLDWTEEWVFSIRLLNEVGSLVVVDEPARVPAELDSGGNSGSLAEFGVWFAVEFPSVIPAANEAELGVPA